MAKLLSCVLGPRLYKIYRERDTDRAASSVPETPTAVPAPSSSSWVSLVPPRLRTWYGPRRAGPSLPGRVHCRRRGRPLVKRRSRSPPVGASLLAVMPGRPPPLLLALSACSCFLFAAGPSGVRSQLLPDCSRCLLPLGSVDFLESV